MTFFVMFIAVRYHKVPRVSRHAEGADPRLRVMHDAGIPIVS